MQAADAATSPGIMVPLYTYPASYAENRKMHPEIYSMYAAMTSRAEPNDPLYVNKQAFDVIETNNKFASYFLHIRIAKGVRIYCPLRTKQVIEGRINDSKLIRREAPPVCVEASGD
jgi:hypothetical protein